MSFKAELQIEGSTLNVLACDYDLRQHTDHHGKPSARPIGGQIRLTVESTAASDLFDWMVSNTQTKSGTVVFFRRDTLAKMKELRFTDAYCVGYRESFQAIGDVPMQIDLVLSAREMQLGGSRYENTWPQ